MNCDSADEIYNKISGKPRAISDKTTTTTNKPGKNGAVEKWRYS